MPEALGANAPNPGMMPKRRDLPNKPAGAPLANSMALDSYVPRRGWTDAQVWADTGPLLGFAGKPALLTEFLAHVQGRLWVSSIVEREIRGWARATSPHSAQLAQSARAVVQDVFGTGLATIVSVPANDQPLLDDILLKLQNLPAVQPTRPTRGGSTSRKHAGEAATIASAYRQKEDGYRAVVLSNDGGARQVAAAYGLPVKDVGELLKELVCARRLASGTAFQYFQFITGYTSPPARRAPQNAMEMECRAVSGSCLSCRN